MISTASPNRTHSPVQYSIFAYRYVTCISTDEADFITTNDYSAPLSFAGILENDTTSRHATTLWVQESSGDTYSKRHVRVASPMSFRTASTKTFCSRSKTSRSVTSTRPAAISRRSLTLKTHRLHFVTWAQRRLFSPTSL